MIIEVQEIVPRVNEILKYGETIAPTEQHARLIMQWHVLKGNKFTVEKVQNGWLVKLNK